MMAYGFLQRTIVDLETLLGDEQNATAVCLLAVLADEQAWAAQFDAATDEQWDRLAESVRREISSGYTTSLEDVFPNFDPA